MSRFNNRQVTVTFEDSTGVTLVIGPGPGDWTIDGLSEGNTDKIRVLDRLRYDCHLDGEDKQQTGSGTVGLAQQTLTSAIVSRVLDWIHKQGIYRIGGPSEVTTVSPNTDIWAFAIRIAMTGGGVGPTTFEFPNCIAEYAFAEAADGNTVSLSFTNDGAPLLDGVAVRQAS